jgi:HK97 family phage major capsid protein
VARLALTLKPDPPARGFRGGDAQKILAGRPQFFRADGASIGEKIMLTNDYIGAPPWADQKAVARLVPELGISNKEISRYSLLGALRASASRNWSNAGLEAEVSKALEDVNGKPARGFYVPWEILGRAAVSYAGSGDEIVATDHESGSFVDILRPHSAVVRAGARVLTGLRGNVDIPLLSNGASAYWLADENTAVTESLPVLATVNLTPHTVASQASATRRMRIQSSPDIEALLQRDLRETIGTAIDYACLGGTGADGQPQGIFSSYAGVSSVLAGDGTDGAAMTYADVVNLWREVAKDNAAGGALAYMTNSSLVAKLMTTAKVGSSDSVTVMEEFDRLLGFPCYVTEQVASGVTVGSAASCSSIAFGNWNDMIIGVWGTGLDVTVDEITLGTTGGITFRAFQDVDMKVRHASSFAICEDAVDV